MAGQLASPSARLDRTGGMTAESGARGAYGFEIVGLDEPDTLLGPAAPGWPRLEVERVPASAEHRRPEDAEIATLRIDDERAELWLSDTDSLELERSTMRVRFVTTERLSDDLVIHPYVALPAAVASHWLGRQVLHGGAVVREGGAWALLGTKEAGKSSTLAWLHRQGHAIVSDDLLMIEGTTVFAGPRSIDLRDEAASVLGGERVQVSAGRERWRLRPDHIEPVQPLAGLVHLEWGDDVRLEEVEPVARLVLLIGNSVVDPSTVDASAYLDLAALPTWRFVRPRRLDVLDEVNAQLLDVLG